MPKNRHDVICSTCRGALGGIYNDEYQEAAADFVKARKSKQRGMLDGLPEMTEDDLETFASIKALFDNQNAGRSGNRRRGHQIAIKNVGRDQDTATSLPIRIAAVVQAKAQAVAGVEVGADPVQADDSRHPLRVLRQARSPGILTLRYSKPKRVLQPETREIA